MTTKRAKKKMVKKGTGFIIDMNEINLNQRKFTTSEIGRGIGVEPAKKGRRSYNRKKKHKKEGEE